MRYGSNGLAPYVTVGSTGVEQCVAGAVQYLVDQYLAATVG